MKPIPITTPPLPLRRNSQGADVTNLQDGLLLLLRKQVIHTDLQQFLVDGLTREQQAQRYDDATAKTVGIFQDQSHLHLSEEVDQPTAEALNKALKDLGAFDEPAPQPPFVVQGVVRLESGDPLKGVSVFAVDKDVRGEEPLGEPTTTNQDGAYEIGYTAQQFSRAEKDSADIIVRVFQEGANPVLIAKTLLVESPILFNAPTSATIDLVVSLTTSGIPSEFEQLVRAIEPLLVNVTIDGIANPTLIDKLADLKSDDLDFLTQEMGVERQRLEFLTTAAQNEKLANAQQFSIATAVFYGLAREGLPLDLSALALVTVQDRRAALEQALHENRIPAKLGDTLDTILAALQTLSTGHALQTSPAENVPALTQVLAVTLPSMDQQATLLHEFANHAGPIEQYWANLHQHPDFQEPGKVEKVQFTLQLNTLTQSNMPLMNAMQNKFPSTRSMARVAPDELSGFIRQVAPAAPLDVPGATPEEKLALYTDSIVGLLQGAFPTETVAQVVSKVNAAHLNDVPPATVAQVLNRATDASVVPAGQEFDIRSTHVDRFLSQHGDTIFAGLDGVDKGAVTEQVKRVQRLFHVSTSPETLQILLEHGLNSANDIAQRSQRSLIEDLGDKISMPELALIHQRAHATSAVSLQLALHVYQAAHDVSPAVVGESLKEVPDWASLFGSLELCECEECRSMYSPAAYFVDLLQFLDKTCTKNAHDWTPLDVLIGNSNNPHNILLGKRPDLPHIPLTCENTNTLIPYIDLVNEVLESYIAHGRLDQSTAKDTGDSTAEELRANPQFIEEIVYDDTLWNAVFPISLPFDRSLEIARVYYDQLGTSRADVLQLFGAASPILASEQMGITEKEWEIFTGTTFAGQPSTLSLSDLYLLKDENLTPTLTYQPEFTADQIQSGSAVVILQAKLNTDGADPQLTLNGNYDAITSGAVKAFQQRHGLPVDGSVKAADWAVLATIKPDAVGAVVAGVPEFLHRTELHYVELVELLKTRYINANHQSYLLLENAEITAQEIRELIQSDFANPSQQVRDKLTKVNLTLEQVKLLIQQFALLIIPFSTSSDSSDLSKMLLEHLDGSSVDEKDLWKLQRFIRLWRKLGWTSHELDTALGVLGYPDEIASDDTRKQAADCINKLAQVRQIQAEINIPLIPLLSLWGHIDTYGDKPLYNTLFQNRAVLTPTDPDFQLNVTQDELAVTTKDLAAKRPILLAALRMRDIELAAVLDDTHLQAGNLTLANLSALYRYALLAKALRLPVKDLIALKALRGVASDPFILNNPASTLAFIRLVQEVRQTGFLVPQLDYLYRHQFAETTSLPPSQASLKSLVTLQQGLGTIVKDNASVDPKDNTPLPDPDGEVTRTKLGQLFDGATVDAIVHLIDGTAVYTTSLSTLPPITFPDPVKNKLHYEAKTLRFTGAMTDKERNDLRGLSFNGDYRAAIDNLYQQPRSILTTRQGKKGEEQRAITDFLSLSDAEVNLLNKPSLDQDALPILLDQAGNPTTVPDDVRETAVAHKFTYFLTQFLPYLREVLSRSLITQTLSEILFLDTGTMQLLLANLKVLHADQDSNTPAMTDFLTLGDVPADQPLPARVTASFERLHKIAMLVNTFKLTAQEVEYWYSSDVGALNLDDLPLIATDIATLFTEWQTLADYVLLRNSFPSSETSLIDVFKADDTDRSKKLATVAGWSASDVESARDALGLQNVDLKQPKSLLLLQEVLDLSTRVGVKVEQLHTWATTPTDTAQAQDIKNAVKAKYTEQAWLEVAGSLSDKLRESQRNALVAYVLTLPAIRSAHVTDANRLYEYFLIDVEMSACMVTSRIKQAISSVQLFVQRCLLNLEPGVRPKQIVTDHWQWMKNYRVWEANRKVLFYSENWTEPGLRDDKSPFFQELESELLQNDVANEVAEKALLNYLFKLAQVARLEVCGMYLQDDFDSTEQYKSILHVFARTMGGMTRSYYYRRLIDNTTWTPWEKVELDIQGAQGSDESEPDGIDLLPVVWNRRLYLFWLNFTAKADVTPKTTITLNVGTATDLPPEAKKYWEINLAWSTYDQGKWTAKQITDKSSLRFPVAEAPTSQVGVGDLLKVEASNFVSLVSSGTIRREQVLPSRSDFKLKGTVQSDGLYLIVYYFEKYFVGNFHLDDYNGGVSSGSTQPSLQPPLYSQISPASAHTYFMGYEGGAHLEVKSDNTASTVILGSTSTYDLLTLNQNYPHPERAPYFFQNGNDVYFVRSREFAQVSAQIAQPSKVIPFSSKYQIPNNLRDLGRPAPDPFMERAIANPWIAAEQVIAPQKLSGLSAQLGV